MANEMSLFTTGASIPAHIAKRELSETTKALMGGSSDARRISVRGNIFRLTVGGQEVAKNEDRAMNIIIAAAAPKTSRQYYGGTYQEGVVSSPDCWSADGESPSPSIESPKNHNCATCSMNIAGSGQGNGRACRYTHRLAVLLENDMHGDVYELSLAATSLFGKGENGKMPLFQYAKQLAGHGMNVTDVVTELRFDTDSATPKMVFRAVRPLEEAEIEAVLEKGSSIEAIQAITTSFSPSRKEEQPAPATKPVPQGLFKDTPVSEPVVREKKPAVTLANPTDLESTLAEWAD
jgi:hypothetical protein